MTLVKSIRAALATGVCLLPLQALAQSDDNFDLGDQPASAAAAQAAAPKNWISIGAQYNTGRSTYLNRFTGASDPGWYGLGDFHYGQRDAWDSGGTWYLSADGKDLGLDSRSFTLKMGQQGTWGAWFSYDGIPYFGADNFKSIWTSSGAVVPGVGYAGASVSTWPATAQFPAKTASFSPLTAYTPAGSYPIAAIYFPLVGSNVAGSLYNYDIQTQRDIFSGGGKWQWEDWTIQASVRHEHKWGYQANSLEIGGTVGLTGNGTGASKNGLPSAGLNSGLGYFAMPIDYDTDRYEVSATYSTPRWQFQAAYVFSNFTDNITEFGAQLPWSLGALNASGSQKGGFSGNGVTPAGVYAPYSLPPSNSAHQIKAMFGYNITPGTRLNANFQYGLQLQNEAYLTASGMPGFTTSIPQNSLNGLVQTFFGNIALVTTPLPDLDVRLAYTIDEHDNQTPRNYYQVDTRSTAQLTGNCKYTVGAISATCMNLPFSFNHQSFVAEAGYQFRPHSKIIINDTFETTYRNYADASFVTQNTASVKVRSQLTDTIFGSVGYAHSDRNANNYANGNTWELMSNGGVEPNAPSNFLMYFEASRKRDEVKGTLDWSAMDGLDIALMTRYASDTYPNTTFGLRNNNNLSIGPDVSWRISDSLEAHAYYTYQQIYYEQSAVYASSGQPALPTNANYYVPWTNKSTDSVHTLGITLNWQAIPEVLKLAFGYNLSAGDTSYALSDGLGVIGQAQTTQTGVGGLTLQQLPNINSMLNIISVRGEYTFRPNWTMLFGVEYERFTFKDWTGVGPTQYANAIFPGSYNLNESAVVLGAGLRVRF